LGAYLNKNFNPNLVAAFDFDGTLTYRDTLIPFLKSTTSCEKTLMSILLATPYLAACLISNQYRQMAKEAILKRTIGGMPIHDLRKLAEKFALGSLTKKIRPEAFNKLQWHLSQGHRCILISANLDVYLKPWALKEGFHDLICSKLEVNSDGKVTGKLLGNNCWGPEKSSLLLQLLGPKNTFTLYAYGDSHGDQELLKLADHPFYRTFYTQGAQD
jgi:phosphatidylglycerophosphatase C